ncbi:tyrosine-protein kinase SYK-like [Rhopilema esculentum]|uniref:tyrosine-protein kinase SYK-like n=1 Tax=Rhopilema esculentum TaxID=499914 RepID=UPI0031DC1DAB
MSDPNAQSWFHGRISREQAEKLLNEHSTQNGKYLLRESSTQLGSYVLSVCYNGNVVHYQILKNRDGTVGIADGLRFPGPVELIHHHEVNLDGLLTRLTIPCEKPVGVKAKVYRNITHDDLEEASRAALWEAASIDSEEAVLKFKVEVEDFVGNILHKKQQWYHGIIPREEADRRLETKGNPNGCFLFRERGGGKSEYVLGVLHDGKAYHYLFSVDAEGKLSIKAGRKFLNLMQIVDYYTQKSDGLLCKLTVPCDISRYQVTPILPEKQNILLDPDIQKELRRRVTKSKATYKQFQKPRRPKSAAVAVPGGGQSHLTAETPPPVPSSPNRPPIGVHGHDMVDGSNAWKYEGIYDSIKVKGTEGYENPFLGSKEPRKLVVEIKRLKIQEELGHGNFGSVMKGIYMIPNGKSIAVAVKTLKEENIPNQQSEIIHEAEIMAKLDHPNIVRMIGVTQGTEMMLVMELAPEGPLNKYLKKHKNMAFLNILILMLQVDEGMQYLESQHFVHRDLAARNVLVVSENFVKISDFGMSRAMGAGNEYYRAERAGKWPLKWYAPECIFYFKFTSKSDVWSYGVTMWEALNYGAKPYSGKKGQQLVEDLERGYRLECPLNCPKEIHNIMKRCWEWQPEKRPTFHEIGNSLFSFIEKTRRKHTR